LAVVAKIESFVDDFANDRDALSESACTAVFVSPLIHLGYRRFALLAAASGSLVSLTAV
jgi:hypothetical protein